MHLWLRQPGGTAAQETYGLDTYRQLLEKVLAGNQVRRACLAVQG